MIFRREELEGRLRVLREEERVEQLGVYERREHCDIRRTLTGRERTVRYEAGHASMSTSTGAVVVRYQTSSNRSEN